MGSYLNALKNYKNFSGRTSRKEYWMFFLFNILISIGINFAVDFMDSLVGLAQMHKLLIPVLYQIFVFVPSIAVGVRRLHDMGRSGWWILFPVVGFIMLFFKSQPCENQYGGEYPVSENRSPKEFFSVFAFPFIKLLFAVFLLALAVQIFRYPEKFREYRLYLSGDRPSIDLYLRQLSQNMSEGELLRKYPDLKWNCYKNYPGENFDERSCYADISSFNDMPAMFIGFHFAQEGLNHMTVAVPWWQHRALMHYVESSLGVPEGIYPDRKGGVPLMGWKLKDGNAVFINARINDNTMMWNLIYWTSQRACLEEGCFVNKIKQKD
jgi:uncharacterized membrane protein YhaH (DUF805 family)